MKWRPSLKTRLDLAHSDHESRSRDFSPSSSRRCCCCSASPSWLGIEPHHESGGRCGSSLRLKVNFAPSTRQSIHWDEERKKRVFVRQLGSERKASNVKKIHFERRLNPPLTRALLMIPQPTSTTAPTSDAVKDYRRDDDYFTAIVFESESSKAEVKNEQCLILAA